MTMASQLRPVGVDRLTDALSLLREQRVRLTGSRQAVLRVLFADTTLRTAEEIAVAAYVDLASAYRNLETLEQLGIVRHVHLGHGPGLYARAGLAELEHAVCESCGVAPVGAGRRAAGRTRRDLRRHRHHRALLALPVVGRCESCTEDGATVAGGTIRSVHVGIDLIEIDRIAAALARHPERFRERVYTPREVAECERKPRPAQSYAGRFAGKEAVGKALGRGVPFTWTEIEIAGRGKPLVTLSGSMAGGRRAARRRPGRPVDDALEDDGRGCVAIAVTALTSYLRTAFLRFALVSCGPRETMAAAFDFLRAAVFGCSDPLRSGLVDQAHQRDVLGCDGIGVAAVDGRSGGAGNRS